MRVYTLQPAYYSDELSKTDNTYQAGYAEGVAAGTTSSSATITYTVKHAHGEYCYPIPTGSYTASEGHETADDGHSTVKYYSRWVTCSACDKTFGHKGHSGWPSDDEVRGL